MSTNGSRPAVVLRQGRELSIRRRHPWVFSGAVLERKGAAQRGGLVDVLSKDGAFLGCGHWGTRGIAVRMLSFEPIQGEEQLLAQRIGEAATLRKRLGLLEDPHTTGFRVIHAEGDGLSGLVVDRYGDTAVVQCHSSGMWRLRDSIGALLTAHPDLHISHVEFRRVEAQIEDQDEKDSSAPATGEPHVVTFLEGGLRFLVDVSGGQKTGFFLDQRVNRAKVRSYAAGKKVLNAFSYTGAFSVYAFAGGAESVSSVDASKAAVDLARQNVVANFASASHHPEVADCFSYLAEIPDTFDMIILDPPAFAKHQRAVQRAVRGYETINALALKKIKSGGLLFTFSCSQLVSRDLFRDTVSRAAVSAGRNVRIIESLHQAPCHPISAFHPEGDYLKGFVLYVE
jgi:23S rRNA (cytosine1962-C5)-methyltransferase